MFVEQSAGRIRCVRMLFVLGGFMPCMGLVTLALWRSSDMHSSTIRRGWEESLGVPLAIESVEHLRPGAIRLHGLDVLAPSGETVLSVHALDVEMSACSGPTGRIGRRLAAASRAILSGVGCRRGRRRVVQRSVGSEWYPSIGTPSDTAGYFGGGSVGSACRMRFIGWRPCSAGATATGGGRRGTRAVGWHGRCFAGRWSHGWQPRKARGKCFDQ